MNRRTAANLRSLDIMSGAQQANKSRFRLVSYFSVAGSVAFLAVAVVLYLLEQREGEFFRHVQLSQKAFVARVQESFAREQEAAARRDLLLVHEAGHVNTARLLANAMWATHVAPLVARAQSMSFEHCHALGEKPVTTRLAVPTATQADCFAAMGNRIAALPEFAALDAKVAATIRASTVFKIKVFDPHGVTVYSSEHAQTGEDKYGNQGWRIAAGGQPASELTHRDKFSAFEGVVENRDLISSYVPVKSATGDAVLGVFEIYSDVTPFLAQIKAAFVLSAERAAANQAKLDHTAAENQRKVETESWLLLFSVGLLLLLLYLVLLLIVRHAQRILDAQTHAQEQFVLREERWHHEKMSALATMAATIAHEIGNPLATIAALAESVDDFSGRANGDNTPSRLIVEQTRRIAAKTRQIANFAAARREDIEPVDVNQMIRALCDFLEFDRDFQGTTIQFEGASLLPARSIVPDHLTESLMNLLQAYMEYGCEHSAAPRKLLVTTTVHGENVAIRIACDTLPAADLIARTANDPRMVSTRRRVAAMGGELRVVETAVEIVLPPAANGAGHKQAMASSH